MNNYTDIIFDFDGTVIDSGEGITRCVQYALHRFGIEEPDRSRLRRFVGPSLSWALKTYYGFNDEQCVEGIRYYRELYLSEGIYQNTIYPGITELLDALGAAGCTRYVASGKPEPFVEKICEHMGLRDRFEYIAGADLKETRTSKAQIIQRAIGMNPSCDPAHVLMIGDRYLDINGAKENGVASAGILWGGYGTREEHIEAGADYIAETPAEILRIVCG